jgi:hypothetical protein
MHRFYIFFSVHDQKFRLFILSSRSTQRAWQRPCGIRIKRRPRRAKRRGSGRRQPSLHPSPPNIVPYRCRKRSAAANTYTHSMDASHHHWELNESKSPLELQALLRHRIVWHCHCQVPHNRIEYLLTARRQHRLWPAAQRRPHLVPERYTRPQHCPPIVRLRCTPRCRA